ncbi:MAG: amino acid adenylation domain-containing protein, partial [Thermoanaerobaculia bacterium]|nr:amino acid adenylation domain-containing protein [Thermoanaerobaculia bacterium]
PSNPRPGEGEEEGVIEESADTEVSRDSVKSVVEVAVGAAPRGRPSWAGEERGPGGEVSLTYAQLDARSNQLAHRLRHLGVGQETLVAIVIERSVELSVALLGILKSGGAYLPIDPSWPSERIAYMLDDAQVPVLLTLGRLRANLPETSAVVLELDDPATLAGEPESPVVPAADDPSALAYVIYTSGSTGRPKGTLNSHRGILNRLLWMAPAMGLSADDRFLQKTPVSFDVSVWELFVPLILGARLVYAAPGRHGDPDYLVEWIEQQKVTVCHFVPSMLQAFVAAAGIERCTSLRRVVASGEALPPDLVARWYARLDVPLWNLYGPTETAVEVSYHATSARTAGAPVPIGRPLPNTRLVVIDASFRPVPPGVPGELTIGGVQVGRGYRNRPALTAAMFVPDPFGEEPGTRMYRTGDLARALPNGEIEYLGRIDHQVKIRGFRIELGEIEAALAEHPDVQAAVVLAKAGPSGDARLVGYVTVVAGGDIEEGGHGGPPQRIDSDAPGSMTTATVGTVPRGRPPGPSLRDFLATCLPEYMIPTAFVTLEAFPLTPSGKVDRKALATLEVELGSSAEFVAPRSAAEALVAEIFAEVLGVEQVSAEDDFFGLGGHSLKAIQLVSRLRAAWGLDLPLKALFETPTVAGLAARLGYERGETAESPFPHLAGDGPFELSFAQGRLWFLDRLEPGGVQYNIPTALRLRGPLDPDRLARALTAVVARHETLRTRFVEGAAGEPEVWITPVPEDLLAVVDLTDLPETERLPEAGRRAAAEARRPFDLTSGRLIRALLLVLGPEDHGFVVIQHHIASDGWSLGIAMADLAAFYRAEGSGQAPELAPLPVRYVEFARWQRDELAGHLEERLAFWREALAGAPPVLGLATDRPRPLQPSGRGGRVSFTWPAATLAGLRALAENRGATLFMVLLAAWQALLARHAGVDDVVVGSPVAGRLRKEVEPLVGFFVNTLALRARPAEASRFGELVTQVKDSVLAAFAHQDLPFERLVEELAPDRGGGHPPIFQVAFALQNAPVPPNFAGLAAEALEFAGTTAKFDLLLNVRETDRGLVGGLEFDTDLFDRTTAERLVARLERFVVAAVAAPERRLGEFDWLSPVERQQLLEWNATGQTVPAATVHGLFAAQAQRTPDAVAVSAASSMRPSFPPPPGGGLEGGGAWGPGGEVSLTYAQLDARSNQLAHRLRRLGVGRETLVAIVIERSVELSVALLGILKSGGAYLPIDPSWPSERIAYMLDDAQVPVLLTLGRLRANLPETAAVVLELDDPATLAGEPESPVVPAADDPNALAYVIYTSGSTGRPKGTLNSHRGIVNRLLWMAPAMGLSADDRFLQKTPVSFDVSVWELFVPLILGARLVYAAPGRHGDPDYLVDWIEQQQITVCHFVPSMLQVFVAAAGIERCTSLRRVVASGEALPPDLVARWYARLDVPLWNLYGPTETAVEVSYHATSARTAGAPVPIGRPLPNTRLVVIDATFRPVPPGVPGELTIGGVQVGRGYRNRPALTASMFVPDPFSDEPGARMYRTGDLARALPNGEIEYLGRIDHQVKIRGFRIELGEIEAALAEHPEVQAAVVLARPGAGGDARLVGYVTVVAGGDIEEGGHGGPPLRIDSDAPGSLTTATVGAA